MYNNKINTSFPPIMGGGGNYNLEYSNNKEYRLLISNLGCNDYCTSSCGGVGTAYVGCSGCDNGCHDLCTGCSGVCVGGCYDSCKGSCSGCSGCGGACSTSCSGCDGCSGCGSGCATGCSGTCKNTCQGLCTGSGSKVSIDGTIKTSKFYIGIDSTVKQSNTQYVSINGVIKQI